MIETGSFWETTFRDGDPRYGFLPNTVPTRRGAAADRPLLLLDRVGGLGQPPRRGPQLHQQLAAGPCVGNVATPETYIWSLGGIVSLFVSPRPLHLLGAPRQALVRRGQGGPAGREADRRAADLEPAQGGQVLPGRDPALPGADHLRRAAGPLHGPSGDLLHLRRSAKLIPYSWAKSLAPAARHLLDRHHLGGIGDLPRADRRRPRAAAARACWSSSCSARSCWWRSAA